MFRTHHRPEPGPQLTPWGFYAMPTPTKARDPLRAVAIGLVVTLVLLVGGCFAVVGGIAHRVGTAFEATPAPAAAAALMEVQDGEAFLLSGFQAAGGWTVTQAALGGSTITGLHVTNIGDTAQSMRYAFTFRSGTRLLAEVDCWCPTVLPDQTTAMQCFATAARMPFGHDQVVVADSY